MTRPVGALCRVSTGAQDVAAQRLAIDRWRERTGRDVHLYDEGAGVSGALTEADRPGLAAMMQAARAGELEAVACCEVSRLGAFLRMALEVYLAAKERERVGERTARGLANSERDTEAPACENSGEVSDAE